MKSLKELKEFLVLAKKNTYANDNSREIRRRDLGKELTYKKGKYTYRDIYYGNNPFSGQEIVWQGNKILWSMNYYGCITEISIIKDITIFLKECLRQVPKNMPFRGPKKLSKNNFKYINNIIGDVKYFNGYELIKYKNRRVYMCIYNGGLIKK